MKLKQLPRYLTIRNKKWTCRNPYTGKRKTLKLKFTGSIKNKEAAIRERDDYLKPWRIKAEAESKKEAFESVYDELQEQKERLKKYRMKSNALLLSEATMRCYKTKWKDNKTKDEQLSKMNYLIKELDDPDLTDIIPGDLYDIREQLEEYLTIATVNRYMASIKTILNQAMKHWLIIPYVIHVPITQENEGRIRYITYIEEEIMLDLIRNRKAQNGRDYEYSEWVDYIIYLIDTGARVSEALNQEIKNINLDKREIHIWKNKTDNPRTIAMTDRVYEICKKRSLNNPEFLFQDMKYHVLRKLWDYLREEMKIDDSDFVPHCLRHTCCTRLWQKNVDIKTIMLWMGHTNIKTTMRYAHLDASSLHDAAKVLNQ